MRRRVFSEWLDTVYENVTEDGQTTGNNSNADSARPSVFHVYQRRDNAPLSSTELKQICDKIAGARQRRDKEISKSADEDNDVHIHAACSQINKDAGFNRQPPAEQSTSSSSKAPISVEDVQQSNGLAFSALTQSESQRSFDEAMDRLEPDSRAKVLAKLAARPKLPARPKLAAQPDAEPADDLATRVAILEDKFRELGAVLVEVSTMLRAQARQQQ